MATIHAAAEKRAKAIIKLTLAMRAIGEKLDIEPAVIPSHVNSGDVVMAQANILDALAEWMDGAAVALGVEPDKLSEYSGVRKARLVEIAQKRGIEFDPENVTVTILLELLEADDQRRAAAPEFTQMTVKQLKAYAADRNIDLGTATRRDDIIAVLNAAPKNAESATVPTVEADPGEFESVEFDEEGNPRRKTHKAGAKLDGTPLVKHERLQGVDLKVEDKE